MHESVNRSQLPVKWRYDVIRRCTLHEVEFLELGKINVFFYDDKIPEEYVFTKKQLLSWKVKVKM